MKAIDCQGLGGGMTLGMVQAGFTVVAKHEQPGGFGFVAHEGNRHLLGDYPMSDEPADEWPVHGDDVDLVFGCPPCSGFSALSVRAGGRDMRSATAAINHCMWDFWRYAARANPKVIAMESVPQASKMGLPLMRDLHRELMAITGHGWYLTHVLHNNLSVGGCSMRPRYFLVASRLAPFGIASPRIDRVPTLHDAIGDLENLPLGWDPQPHAPDPLPWWAGRKMDTHVITGHALPGAARRQHMLESVCTEAGWRQGEMLIVAVERHWRDTGGTLSDDGCEVVQEGEWPSGLTQTDKDSMLYRPIKKRADFFAVERGEMSEDAYLTKWRARQLPNSAPYGFVADMYQPSRWYDDRPARVVNGGSLGSATHPSQPRTFTYREAARIMGFPDSWNVEPYVGHENMFGKAVSVDIAFWLGYWLKQHVADPTGATTGALWTGDEVTDEGAYYERRIDVTQDWKAALPDADKRKAAQLKIIEARPA